MNKFQIIRELAEGSRLTNSNNSRAEYPLILCRGDL